MFAITNNSAARGNGDHARLGKTRVREARRRCREATARLQAMTDPTVMTGGLGPVAAAPVAVVQAAEAAEVVSFEDSFLVFIGRSARSVLLATLRNLVSWTRRPRRQSRWIQRQYYGPELVFYPGMLLLKAPLS